MCSSDLYGVYFYINSDSSTHNRSLESNWTNSRKWLSRLQALAIAYVRSVCTVIELVLGPCFGFDLHTTANLFVLLREMRRALPNRRSKAVGGESHSESQVRFQLETNDTLQESISLTNHLKPVHVLLPANTS